jgi:hypothetical protein
LRNNQQLAVAIVEDSSSRTFDGLWSIDDTARFGGREYIFVFNTPYSPNPSAGPIPFPLKNLSADANTLPILYGLWPALLPGHSMHELAEGQRIVFDVQDANLNGPHTELNMGVVRVGSRTTALADITCSSLTGLPGFSFALSDSSLFGVTDDTLTEDTSRPKGVIAVREIATPLGLVDPPDGRNVLFTTNSTGDYQVVTLTGGGLLSFNPYDPILHDWEIRFTQTGSVCYDYSSLERLPGRVPFEIWNVGDAALNDPSDDQRLAVILLDNDADGRWDYEERSYAAEQPYQENGPSILDLENGDISLRRIMFRDISHFYPAPPPGTIVRYISAKNFLTGKTADAQLEPAFTGEQFDFRHALTAAGELGRKIRVSFTPRTPGLSTGFLQVIDSSRNLTVAQIPLSGSTEQSCCQGTTGNVDALGTVDLADLTKLVDLLLGGSHTLASPCSEEANINAQGIIDLADLALLVSYLTDAVGSVQLPNCPALPTQ